MVLLARLYPAFGFLLLVSRLEGLAGPVQRKGRSVHRRISLLTLALLSLGLLLSGLRWATVDQFLERECWIFGEALPRIDFKELDNKDTLVAFLRIVENHYRYYQYYSNSLVAVELGGLFIFGT